MNKKTKSGIILSSLGAIALAGALLTGATYALFTSENQTNIAVTSGKVNVEATASDLWVYSPTTISTEVGNAILDDTNAATELVEGVSGQFFNGGTATLNASEGTVVLDKMTPGDKVTFKLTITNKSNVKTKYRTVIKKVDPTDDYLYSVLDFNIGGMSPEYYSVWQTLEAPTSADGETVTTYDCKVELPTTVSGSNYMDKKCTIAINVEAIQANAYTEDEEATTVVTKNVESSSDTLLMDGDTKEESTVVVEAPAGSTDATTLTLVKTPTEVPGNITIETGNSAISNDVKIIDQDGNKVTAQNNNFFTVTVQLDPNLTILSFYHNATKLTRVDTYAELTAKDLFYYDVNTGKLTFTTVDFSVFTAEVKFSGGVGTEAAPYLIATSSDFAGINNEEQSTDKHYKQIADITADTDIEKFAGTYDGGGYTLTTTKMRSSTKSVGCLFNELNGHGTFKNINVTMSDFAITLLWTIDWGTAYGADFDNITFNSDKTVKVNSNNFGFVTIDAIYSAGTGNPVYNFSNIINNVSVENIGSSTGALIGSGPFFTLKSTLNFNNCVNNGNLTGVSYCGFLYGNGTPTYIDTIASSDSVVTVSNCKNNGILQATSSTGICALMPNLDSLNTQYQESCGGTYIVGSTVFANKDISVNQNGTSFTVKGASTGYTYKLALSVGSQYYKKDSSAWTDEEVATIAQGGTAFDTYFYISNGIKYEVDLTQDETAVTGHTAIKALDKRTAKAQGIDTDSLTFTNNFVLVANDNVTYLVLDLGDHYYINSSVSLLVNAYDGNGSFVGSQTVK